MTVFGSLARFYDTVYADKDYRAEAEYVMRLLDEHAGACREVLELGSGTGRHALELVRGGRRVHGIDASADMVALARQRAEAARVDALDFDVANAVGYRAGKRFDAVLACFHVLNYMATPEQLRGAFETAAAHLVPGGCFLFDSWYGPAVVATGAEVRVRDIATDRLDIVRIAEPSHAPERQTVTVRFRFFVRERPALDWHLIEELHPMRYLFTDEVAEVCRQTGFELVVGEEWLSRQPLTERTWNACYLARRT